MKGVVSMGADKKTAVVTGATGMIGIALIEHLIGQGYTVYAVVRPSSERIKNIPLNEKVRIVDCDLNDIKSLPGIITEPCELFFHLAWDGTYGKARNDMLLQTNNITAAVNAAEAAAQLGCKVFVGAGSQAEYGRKSAAIAPDTPISPENGYGIAKFSAGQMTRIICGEHNIKHIWCRIFSVYGPYDSENTMVMSGIKKMMNNEIPLYTKGEQQWDYLYCDDAAAALFLAAVKGVDGSVYCIGSGQTKALKEYIYIIRDAVDPSRKIGLGELPYYSNQVMYLCADISSLTRDTGFVPEYSFEEGIRKTIDWYIHNRN